MAQEPRFRHALAGRMATVVLYLACSTEAFGWCPFAHYQGAPPGLAWKVNLPDIVDSKNPLGVLSFEVSEWFGWGHCCHRMGVYTIPPNLVEPNTPTSHGCPSGVEHSEWDMYHLRSKMTTAHREAENDYLMLLTARGWLAHNMMDSLVHFTYFLGGSAYNWISQHKWKEEWADLVLFEQASGGQWGTYEHGMRSTGHGGIICLAQKCFRKNRQTVDGVLPYSLAWAPGPVDTRQQIDKWIDNQDKAFIDKEYTEGDYNTNMNRAAVFGWNTAAMLAIHATAAANAAAAVGGMP